MVCYRCTEKVAQIFSYVYVDSGDNTRIRYWMQDTSIEYFSFPHIVLMVVVGLPVGLFVTLGFPVFVFFILLRNIHNLYDENVVSRYGFFYQGYELRCAYWEVAIYLRKSTIAILTTISDALAPTLQAFLALATLVICLAAQVHYEPYKESKLDKMEAASLFVSISVYILGGMIQCVTSKPLSIALSIILIALLLSFVAYMLFEICVAYFGTWQEWIRVQEEYKDHLGGFKSICRVVAKVLVSRSKSTAIEVKVRLKSLGWNAQRRSENQIDTEVEPFDRAPLLE